MAAMRKRLRKMRIDSSAIFAKIEDIIVKTVISVEPILFSSVKKYCHFDNSCFELFGFDILIDELL